MALSKMCSVDGCGKPSSSKQLCHAHYSRLRRHGDVNATRPSPATTPCTAPSCQRMSYAKSMCQQHYNRKHRTGSPAPFSPMKGSSCSVPDCDQPFHSRGYCPKHYQRAVKNGSPTALHSRFYAGAVCGASGCRETAKKGGFCEPHYRRARAHGDPLISKRSLIPIFPDRPLGHTCAAGNCSEPAHSRGICRAHYGRFQRQGVGFDEGNIVKKLGEGDPRKRNVCKRGYVYFADKNHPEASKNGNVLEHRAVMAEKIGRKLLPGENAHHRNGIRSDNTPKNLELWVKHQPPGQRAEDLLAWAEEMVARYRPLKEAGRL